MQGKTLTETATLVIPIPRQSTGRAQTSLAEASQNPKASGSLPAPRSGHVTIIMVFLAHFAHLRRPSPSTKFNQFYILPPWTPP